MTPDELATKMLAVIDRERMREIEAEHSDKGWAKFFDVEEYVRRAAHKAFLLGLDRGGMRFLDVGGGFGYVGLASDLLGNQSMTIEVPHKIINEVSRCVPTVFYSERIVPFQRITVFRWPFDLVNMTGVNLVDKKTGLWWDAEAYQFLVTDLLTQVVPGGRLRIEFNRGEQTDFLRTHRFNEPHDTRDNMIVFVKG